MKINTQQLTEEQVMTTSDVAFDMHISEKNIPLMFKMLVEQLYRNKLGSMIREITSNAHDSHVEAGVDEPVIVELKKELSGHYISFIDNGVGMSPERVEKVYCELGESTKRLSDAEIGGFGIGGKTPLAYSKSFFIETRWNGVKYHYVVRMDSFVPKVELMGSEETTERNGTEVRVPLLEKDIYSAENELTRQLFYFDDVYFKGWSEDVTNDYKIVRGKHFVFRSDRYAKKMHICLGMVAYPIDWDALGHEDYEYGIDIPIGLKFNVGELKPIPSREDIEYTDEAKEIIINKIKLALEELTGMLSVKYDNVKTIEDYYNVHEDFGWLSFDGIEQRINLRNHISKSDINYENFKFNEFKYIPSRDEALDKLFNYKKYGKPVPKRWYNQRNDKAEVVNHWSDVFNVSNTYFAGEEFNRTLIKQAYLKDKHHDRFYIVTQRDVTDYIVDKFAVAFGCAVDTSSKHYDGAVDYKVTDEKATKSLIKEFIGDLAEYVENRLPHYDDVVVPEDYVESRNKQKKQKNSVQSKIVRKKTIPVKGVAWGGRPEQVKVGKLIDYKGLIVYGFRDDSYKVKNAYNFAQKVVSMNGTPDGIDIRDAYYNINKGGMFFGLIAQGNEKYMKMVGKKAIYIDDFYKRFISRKVDKIINGKYVQLVKNSFDDVNDLFKRKGFEAVSKEIADDVRLIADWIEANKDSIDYAWYVQPELFSKAFGIELEKIDIKDFQYIKELKSLLKKSEVAQRYYHYLSIGWRDDINTENPELLALLKLGVN